ncbi:hypothetical protein F6A46_02255 [Tenacibaculum finnmarkense genomovar ulcerans]|uniref:hypothetical protein n=1 Tax=Tenacibaculum finnmarkense TaxID=2781243 RepID=UPI00187BB81A|nr:hypothetical protein [Tenacibaculum finnmarkense]MBE7687052.1 hypothetical protein [Tenacibaculum finnmarkense genomovar ulcerans]
MKKMSLLWMVLLTISHTFVSCKSEEKKEEVKLTSKIAEKSAKKEKRKTASFNYKPTKPINGTLKGVVELGASGFNSFIVAIDKNNNWEMKSKEFGNSLIAEGITNTEEVNKKLKKYIQRIIEFGVKPSNIHFVVSSGANKQDITKLIKQELKRIGYVVNVVTPEQEGQYALDAVIPKRFEKTAYLVDIGSGNTKISYLDSDKMIGKETYGAKYFQQGVADTIVYKAVHKVAEKIPSNRASQCFIIGGVPYQLAKSLRKGNERYTVLNKDTNFYQKVIKRRGEKIKSGLNIFKAINDVTKVHSVIFDWDANFTIGFLLATNGKK